MLDIMPPPFVFCPLTGDELKTKIQEDREYLYCPKCKWMYYPKVSTAAVAVIVREDEVVLVKRNREPYKDTWMFPAGFTEYGEHPIETVLREVQEEVGLVGHSAKLLDVLQSEDDPREPGHLVFFYRVKATGELANNDQDENSEIAWKSIKNPPEIGLKSHKQILSQLQKKT